MDRYHVLCMDYLSWVWYRSSAQILATDLTWVKPWTYTSYLERFTMEFNPSSFSEIPAPTEWLNYVQYQTPQQDQMTNKHFKTVIIILMNLFFV